MSASAGSCDSHCENHGSSSQGPRDVYVASASHAFVSQSGMVALLKSVREHGLPEHISRQTLRRMRARALPGHTPLGPLQSILSLIEEQGGTLELPCISPWPLLFAGVSPLGSSLRACLRPPTTLQGIHSRWRSTVTRSFLETS